MAYGEIVADRDVVMLQIFVEHVVHIGKTIVRTLVLGEMSHNDAFQLRQNASDFKLVEHPVHLRHSLAGILDKEYQSLVGAVQS